MDCCDIRTWIEACAAPKHGEFQRFREVLKKPVIIYGAGYRGKLMCSLCREFRIPVAAVCDKNLAGTTLPEMGQIRTFPDAVRGLADYQVVIASVPYRDEIERYVRSVAPACEVYSFDFPGMIEVGNTGPGEYRRFLLENLPALEWLAEALSDGLSRETLRAVIKARLTWDYACLRDVAVREQYFPPDIITLGDSEVFYDCGAYIGDSLGAFKRHTRGRFRRAVCFEPGAEAGETLLRDFAEEAADGSVVLIPKAVSDREETLGFRNQTSGSRLLDTGSAGTDSRQVETARIDTVAQNESNVSYIKMDVEGSELAALRGAEQTIRRFRPKLAICVYHKVEDLVEIPRYIDSLQLRYRYYLRHHSGDLCETVFYAIP